MCVSGSFGGRSRIRTYDPLIKSQLLYQLSYAPAPEPAAKPPWSKAAEHTEKTRERKEGSAEKRRRQ